MPLRSCRSRRRRRRLARCRDRRSRRRCGVVAGNAGSTNAPVRFRPCCGLISSKRQLWSPTRWDPPSLRWLRSSQNSPPRSNSSKPSWPTVLTSTRTPRSSAPCQDSGRFSAPGRSVSSGTTRTAMWTPSLARTTPGCHPSPGRQARAMSCLPVTPAIVGSQMPATSGHRGDLGQPRRSSVLRRAPKHRQHPQPSVTGPRQPARRHPPRLPPAPHPI